LISFHVQAGLLVLSAPDEEGSSILPSAAIYLPFHIATIQEEQESSAVRLLNSQMVKGELVL